MRDYRSDFIREVKLQLADILEEQYMDVVVASVSNILDKYELTERSTELVPFDDANKKLIKVYTSSIIVDGKSKNTVCYYLYILKQFLAFLGNKDLKSVSSFDIRNYLASEKVRGISNRTLENIRSTLSAFYTWLTTEDYIVKNPCASVKPIKYKEEVRKPFSQVELDKIRSACASEKERAIVEFLLSSGVRVSELVAVNVDDVDFQNKAVRIRHGKGDKERVVYINDLALEHLIRYMTEEKIESGALFQSRRGTGYTAHGIRIMTTRLGKASGVENVHPHRFRRTFATTLATRGMDIQNVKTLMGHTNLNTTMVYVSLNDSQVNNSYRRYAI